MPAALSVVEVDSIGRDSTGRERGIRMTNPRIPEGNPNDEAPMTKPQARHLLIACGFGIRHSDFGIDSGIRVSSFGLHAETSSRYPSILRMTAIRASSSALAAAGLPAARRRASARAAAPERASKPYIPPV